jgi:hypothetical protein
MQRKDQSALTVLQELKAQIDSGVKGDKAEYICWYDLELGLRTYVYICKQSNKWMLKDEKKRGCKGVDAIDEKELSEADEVEPLIDRVSW